MLALIKKTLESPLDCKEIKSANPKRNQPWIFLRRTDAEAEVPILWPPDAKNWLLGKDPDARKDWRQEEKGMTEDEMIGWHHQLSGWVCGNSGKCWTEKPGGFHELSWWVLIVPGIAKSWTWLNGWTELKERKKVKSLSHVWLFATPWTAARQASLSFTYLLEFVQTHVHWVNDTIQSSHPLSSPSPPALNLS